MPWTEVQQVGLALEPLAHAQKSALAAGTHRQDEARTDEDVEFSDLQLVVRVLDELQHGKDDVVVVFGDDRALRKASRLVDRVVRKLECRLGARNLVFVRIAQRDPHEPRIVFEPVADLRKLKVARTMAVLVGDTVDEHAEIPRWRSARVRNSVALPDIEEGPELFTR